MLRSDGGSIRSVASIVTSGAASVASRAIMFARPDSVIRPVNGAAGVVISAAGEWIAVMGFTIVADRVAAIDVLADTERLAGLLEPPPSR